ncbi:unnamed protein product [Mesocestoides corti]|uniref:Velvet domain-containing protein n=1 Tax=Mesocestoides corti TaxID=53468 RepID=A0A0R3UPT1_MESCO|nr:unnamed protein product [Mesocestoides corti]
MSESSVVHENDKDEEYEEEYTVRSDIRAAEETQIFGPIFFTINVTVADAEGAAAPVIDAGTLGEVNHDDYFQLQQQRQHLQSHEGYASCGGVGLAVALLTTAVVYRGKDLRFGSTYCLRLFRRNFRGNLSTSTTTATSSAGGAGVATVLCMVGEQEFVAEGLGIGD